MVQSGFAGTVTLCCMFLLCTGAYVRVCFTHAQTHAVFKTCCLLGIWSVASRRKVPLAEREEQYTFLFVYVSVFVIVHTRTYKRVLHSKRTFGVFQNVLPS